MSRRKRAIGSGKSQATGADQREAPQPLIHVLRRVAAKDRPKGEADQVEPVRRVGEESLQPVGNHSADAIYFAYIRFSVRFFFS